MGNYGETSAMVRGRRRIREKIHNLIRSTSEIEPQTLRLLGFLLWETLRVGNACALRLRGFQPNLQGEISLPKLFHFDTYECALTDSI